MKTKQETDIKNCPIFITGIANEELKSFII